MIDLDFIINIHTCTRRNIYSCFRREIFNRYELMNLQNIYIHWLRIYTTPHLYEILVSWFSFKIPPATTTWWLYCFGPDGALCFGLVVVWIYFGLAYLSVKSNSGHIWSDKQRVLLYGLGVYWWSFLFIRAVGQGIGYLFLRNVGSGTLSFQMKNE